MTDRLKFKVNANDHLRFVSEVWALELDSGEFAPPIDDIPALKTEVIMCFSCKEDAETAAEYHKEAWGLNCTAVKLMRR